MDNRVTSSNVEEIRTVLQEYVALSFDVDVDVEDINISTESESSGSMQKSMALWLEQSMQGEEEKATVIQYTRETLPMVANLLDSAKQPFVTSVPCSTCPLQRTPVMHGWGEQGLLVYVPSGGQRHWYPSASVTAALSHGLDDLSVASVLTPPEWPDP